ncbi:MAG: allantoinase AllB [Ferruginibacter sp.]
MHFAICSNRVVFSDAVKCATLIIKNGHINAIIEGKIVSTDFEVIDYGNKLIMPGVIDPHVHLNEPGRVEWEGFDTGTRAAICGGVTTLIEMPLNASPVTTTVAAFQEKLNATIGKLHCDIGFWGGVIPSNVNDILPLIDAGILGFKAFLTHSGIDEFPAATIGTLQQVMPIIAAAHLPLLVHAELDDAVILPLPAQPNLYAYYLASRPKIWEVNAIAQMIQLSAQFNCKTHIVHLSAATALPMLKDAKSNGIPITVETGQHYLYFNAESIPDGKTAFKCAPPIREQANNTVLWNALIEGDIDFVATDHSPCVPELKQMDAGDFMKAWGGIASIQFALPVLITTALKHQQYDPVLIAKWLCENPAKLAGIANTKGKIAVGYTADIIVVDDSATFTVTESIIHHRHKITPYIAEMLTGVVEHTYLAGQLVASHGQLIEPGKGVVIFSNA